MDTNRIRGKEAYKLIVKTVTEEYEQIDKVARNTEAIPVLEKQERKRHVKSARAAKMDPHTSNSEDEDSDESEDTFRVNSANAKSGNSKMKPLANAKYPCIISDHDHDIST